MTQDDDVEKVARFEAALNQLVERIAEDRYILAIVPAFSVAPGMKIKGKPKDFASKALKEFNDKAS
jgi:hypothetical protein